MQATPQQVRALIVEDEPITRIALGEMVAQMGAAAHGVSGVEEALGLLRRGLIFHLIVYDWTLKPLGGGKRGLLALRDAAPGAKVAVVTGNDDELVRDWVDDHGMAFISKSAEPSAVVGLLRDLMPGLVRPGTEPAPTEPGCDAAAARLSPRQHEVLDHMALGESDKDIARCLNISHNTVRGHVRDILALLHARNRTHALLLAAGCGLVHPITPHH